MSKHYSFAHVAAMLCSSNAWLCSVYIPAVAFQKGSVRVDEMY